MKVKELIEELEKLDQENQIRYNSDGCAETDYLISGIETIGNTYEEYYVIV